MSEHTEMVYDYGDRQLHVIVVSVTGNEVIKWWTKNE